MSCILLIDDEPTLRDMYRQFLMRAGYEVYEACDGGEGLQQFQTHSVDLVLTDICLPKQDGFALLRTLRMRTPAVKIVAMSGGGQMGNTDLLTRAASLGADRIIQKPIPLRDLLAMVLELLGEA